MTRSDSDDSGRRRAAAGRTSALWAASILAVTVPLLHTKTSPSCVPLSVLPCGVKHSMFCSTGEPTSPNSPAAISSSSDPAAPTSQNLTAGPRRVTTSPRRVKCGASHGLTRGESRQRLRPGTVPPGSESDARRRAAGGAGGGRREAQARWEGPGGQDRGRASRGGRGGGGGRCFSPQEAKAEAE